MNKLILAGFFAAILAIGNLPAEQQPPVPGATPDREKMREKVREKMKEMVPPELRERFDAARRKALEDPEIRKLRDEAESSGKRFFDAMRERMLQIDPGLEDALKKHRPPGGSGGKQGRTDGGGALSDDERTRLEKSRELAMQDPAVKAADAKRSAAKSPQDRKTAGEEFRKAMREALLRIDPSLEGILNKLHSSGPPKPPGVPPAPKPEA